MGELEKLNRAKSTPHRQKWDKRLIEITDGKLLYFKGGAEPDEVVNMAMLVPVEQKKNAWPQFILREKKEFRILSLTKSTHA